MIPGLVLLACVVLALDGQARPFIWLLAVVITAASFFFIYRISGKKKPWWVLLLAGYSAFFFTGFPFVHSDPVGFRYTYSSKVKEGKIDLGSYVQPESFAGPLYLPPGIQPQKIVNDIFDAKGKPLDPGVIAAEIEGDIHLDEVIELLAVQGVPLFDGHMRPAVSADVLLSMLERKQVDESGPMLMIPLYNVIDAGKRSILFPVFGPLFQRSPKFLGFLTYFLGAGVPEEFIKALPIFIFFFWGLLLSDPQRQLRGVTEPLDGIILGAATGAGFALSENLFAYIPKYIFTHGGVSALGLILLRSFDELSGHIAYAGFFGYFIGLAAMRPRRRVRTLLIGYLIAATAHGLWDSANILSFRNTLSLQLVLASASYLLLVAAVVKAREISPNQTVLQPSISLELARRFGKRHDLSGVVNPPLNDSAVVPILDAHSKSNTNPPLPSENDNYRREHSLPPLDDRLGGGTMQSEDAGGMKRMDGQRYTVGRAKNSSLPIADDSVSRMHAEIWFLGPDRIRIRDLGSRNGTKLLRGEQEFVLGEETALSSDQICFGDVTIPVRDLIDALRDISDRNVAARTQHQKLMRCVCGAIRPSTEKCPVCGE